MPGCGVHTPMGSKFSIEQMITTLSRRSRMTSNSNSFQPRHRRFNEDFAIHCIRVPFDVSFEFFLISDVSTSATQREGRAGDHWEPQRAGDGLCFIMRVRMTAVPAPPGQYAASRL